ncbi:Holliday junction resolvase RuvX [Benzoatithermus flavus]|uniref:Putative pre-16S rRNA nuclease n=1 Tax=Benzoatithermus flavus TaxID=3108223 RepID=A0ABU8XX84_9PROT
MTLCDNLGDFLAALPTRGSLLALDLSKRRIGLAGTDPERRLVTPLRTFERADRARDIERLRQVIRERQVVGLVLGLPLNMDGSEGPMAEAARREARRFVAALNLPLLLQDERLTTFAVEDAIEEGRLPRPRKGQPIDHYAAAVILEDALRAMAGLRP